MNERQSKLLVAVINQFIDTASPVGSKRLLDAGFFECSSATLRNEMSQLEDDGFLVQPHVSAGRIPTAKGYRVYVNNHIQPSRAEKQVRKDFETLKEQYYRKKDQERVYDAVSLLSHMIPDIAFATVPHKDRVYYLGLSNLLRQPELQSDPMMGSHIAEVLEEQFANVIDQIEIDEHIRYYIGEDHILPQIQSCSLMVTEFTVRDQRGVVGILGPMRMDYNYNTVALDMIADLLRSGS